VTELDDVLVALHEARLHLAQGHPASALQTLAHHERHLSALLPRSAGKEAASYYYLYDLAQMTRARLWIADNQPERALDALDPLLSEMEGRRQLGTMIEVLTLRGLAWQALGEAGRARTALAGALAIAAPGGYVRTFLDGGESMLHLLQQASPLDEMAAYAARLLVTLRAELEEGARAPTAKAAPAGPSLSEPLSEREHEVLHYLTTDLSTPEIAQMLTITVHTVRTHVKNIYQKLDVHKRVAAVQRAYALDLL